MEAWRRLMFRLRQAEIPTYWPRLASFCTASSAPPRGRGRRWFGTTGEAAPGLRATAQGLRDGGEQTSCSREPEEVEKIGALSISSRRREKVAPLWRAMKSLSREVWRQTTQGRPGHPRAPPHLPKQPIPLFVGGLQEYFGGDISSFLG